LIFDLLQYFSPNLRQELADVAFEWALQAHYGGEEISNDSFKLYTILNQKTDHTALFKLTLFLFKTLVHSDKQKTKGVLEVLSKLPQSITSDPKSKDLAASLGNVSYSHLYNCIGDYVVTLWTIAAIIHNVTTESPIQSVMKLLMV
jgi:hypothetical protein